MEDRVGSGTTTMSKDKELLGKIQHRYTKMIMIMQDKAYEEKLRSLTLWALEERRNRQDLIEVFKMYRGLSNVLLHELFTLDESGKGTRGTCANWLRPGALGILPSIFYKVINRWNLLDQRTVNDPNINAF